MSAHAAGSHLDLPRPPQKPNPPLSAYQTLIVRANAPDRPSSPARESDQALPVPPAAASPLFQLKKGPLPSDHKTVDKLRQIASGALPPDGKPQDENAFVLPDVDPEVVKEEKAWVDAVVRWLRARALSSLSLGSGRAGALFPAHGAAACLVSLSCGRWQRRRCDPVRLLLPSSPRNSTAPCSPFPPAQSKLPAEAGVLAPIIRQLWDHEHGWIFSEPVDTKSWPDYTKVREGGKKRLGAGNACASLFAPRRRRRSLPHQLPAPPQQCVPATWRRRRPFASRDSLVFLLLSLSSTRWTSAR